jgi:hypothetical protein
MIHSFWKKIIVKFQIVKVTMILDVQHVNVDSISPEKENVLKWQMDVSEPAEESVLTVWITLFLKETFVKFKDVSEWKESDVLSVKKDMLSIKLDVNWLTVYNHKMGSAVSVLMDIDRKMAYVLKKKLFKCEKYTLITFIS